MRDTAAQLSDFAAARGSFGLVLPDGWCGRPHDNRFVLAGVREGDVELTLDLGPLASLGSGRTA